MSPLFKISKSNDSSKRQKFIDPGMGDMPAPNTGVISPGNNYNNVNNNVVDNNSSTYVYGSIPSQNSYSQNNINNSNNSNTRMPSAMMYYNTNRDSNQNGISSNNMNDSNVMMPRSVQPPKFKVEEKSNEALEELELPEMKVESLDEIESLDEKEEKIELDPLNNANNPVPVNPVAPKEEVVEDELPEDVKANLFSAISMMIGMIFTPGTTIIKNSKKYRSLGKALTVTLWISVVSILLCMVARIVVGMFSVSYNSVTGASSVNLTFINVFDLDNYTPYLLVAFLMSFGAISISALVYYASSFLNSKGVHMGTYFMVSNLAMVPVIIGVLVLYPILNVFSQYAALLVFVFTFLYTLISFFIGMNEVLTFGNINRRILYNVINLSLIFVIIVFLFLLCYRLNILVPPTLRI